MKNLAAYTAPGANYPPYVSINECEGHVEITVRNHPNPETGMCGDTATIKLSMTEYTELIEGLLRGL